MGAEGAINAAEGGRALVTWLVVLCIRASGFANCWCFVINRSVQRYIRRKFRILQPVIVPELKCIEQTTLPGNIRKILNNVPTGLHRHITVDIEGLYAKTAKG